ncbi:MAG TPA: hypothetical protein DIT64_22390 [Verrucomicrobiales bacterium]|nr:hypothetical protein [Verrucomicrobiales bacterium]
MAEKREDLSEEDEGHLRRAIALSREKMHANLGGPFGAVIAKTGRVVAEGWNQVISSKDPTAHAEVTAIRLASTRLGHFVLEGCTLYSSCEPCPMCLAAAYWARVDRVVYAATRADAAAGGFDDELLYRELPLPPDQRSLPMSQALHSEAARVFDEWRAKADKVMY